MKKKWLWAIVIVVLFLIISIGWLLEYQKVVRSQQVGFHFVNEAPLAQAPARTTDNWLDNLTSFTTDYSYPAQEFEIFVDFVDPSMQAIPQKLIIGSVDDYVFFCLNELFKAREVEFAYSKNINSIDLVVYLPKEYAKAQGLLKELRYYEIPYTYQ